MTRILNLMLASTLVLAAIGVYSIKYEATRQAEKVDTLRRSIEAEHNAIAGLKAQWAYLTQPDRLIGLSGRNLDLQPLKMSQVIKITELPAKVERGDLIAQTLKGLGLDKPDATTGSVP